MKLHACSLVLVLLSGPSAAQFVWDGSFSFSYHNSANWTGDQVPPPSASVIIPAGTPNDPVIFESGISQLDMTIQSGATLTLMQPVFLNIDGDLDIEGALTNGLVGNTVTVRGDLTMGPQAVFVNAGPTELDGDGLLATGTRLAPRLTLLSGTRTVKTSLVTDMTVEGGTLEIDNGQTLTVVHNLTVNAGTVSFDPGGVAQDVIDVNGSVFITGTSTAGSTTPNSVIRCQGHWTSTPTFEMASGRVELDSPGTQFIYGTLPRFPDLRIAGSVTAEADLTVLGSFEVEAGSSLQLGSNELDVHGDWTSHGAGATVEGTEWIAIRGPCVMRTGTNVIPRVRVWGTTLFARDSTVEALDLIGKIDVQNSQTFHVLGDLTGGGTLSFVDSPNNQVLDVDGNVELEPSAATDTTTHRSRIRCAGNWRTTNFLMPNGVVELDGGTTASFHLANTSLPDLRIVDGVKNLSTEGFLTGELIVEPGATLGMNSHHLEVRGDWTSLADATVSGPGSVHFSGTTVLSTGTNSIPPTRVTGTVSSNDASVTSLTLDGGELAIGSGDTLTVAGDAALNGGVLSFSPSGSNPRVLDVNGNVTVTGTVIGEDDHRGRLRCAGDWSSPSTFVMPMSRVELDGVDATIGGPSPTFRDLRLVSGVRTLLSETTVTATLASTGGSTAGKELLVIDGGASSALLSTGANPIARLRVASGAVSVQDSNVGELELAGGELTIENDSALTVQGNALLSGGTLSFSETGSLSETLDVGGDVTITGTLAGPASGTAFFRAAGNWSSPATFVMPAGRVELDGVGATTIGGQPVFPELFVTNGARTPDGDVTIDASSITIASGGALDTAGGRFAIPDTPIDVTDGTLAVGAGGELALGPASTTTIENTGALRVVGAFGAPATVTGVAGGGYALVVNGTLAANHFAFEQPGAGGILLAAGAQLAAPPLDLRAGAFREPSPAAGSVLLELALAGGSTFWFVDFEDPQGAGTFNVRRLAGADVTFLDSAGGFAGPDFEDDPGDRVHWLEAPLRVARVGAQSGPRAVEPERDTAEPWNAALAPNVLSVGARGAFATIQEAIDAAVDETTIVRVGAGSYPAFEIDGLAPLDLHVVGDGSGPVVIDASAQPVVIRDTSSTVTVELADLVIEGGPGNAALSLERCLGAVVLDKLEVHGGPTQPGIRVSECSSVALQRSQVDGAPGLAAMSHARIHASRGALDSIELSRSSTATLCQLDTAERADASSRLLRVAGVMPDIDCEKLQRVGEPLTVAIEADPGAAWLLLLAADWIPFDAGNRLPRMAKLDILASGATDSTGHAQRTLGLPARASLLGSAIPLQLAALQGSARSRLRFSNRQTVFVLP